MQYLIALFIGLLICLVNVPSGLAENAKGVSSSCVINSNRDAVWDVLSQSGHFDDKIESITGNEAVAVQRFRVLPLLGTAEVHVKATAVPLESIEFNLIRSDKLKAFSGSWRLSSIDPTHTRLQLTMRVDPGLPVPRFLVNQFILTKVKSRLKKIKLLVEKQSRKPAHDPQTPSSPQ